MKKKKRINGLQLGEYTMSAKDEGGTSQSRDLYAIRYDGHYTDISKGHDIVLLSLSGQCQCVNTTILKY